MQKDQRVQFRKDLTLMPKVGIMLIWSKMTITICVAIFIFIFAFDWFSEYYVEFITVFKQNKANMAKANIHSYTQLN